MLDEIIKSLSSNLQCIDYKLKDSQYIKCDILLSCYSIFHTLYILSYDSLSFWIK